MSPKATSATPATTTVSSSSRARRLRNIGRIREAIAHAEHGDDQARALWVVFELAAQVHDVRVDRAIERFVLGAERPGHQLLSRERSARGSGHRLEQRELARR